MVCISLVIRGDCRYMYEFFTFSILFDFVLVWWLAEELISLCLYYGWILESKHIPSGTN